MDTLTECSEISISEDEDELWWAYYYDLQCEIDREVHELEEMEEEIQW